MPWMSSACSHSRSAFALVHILMTGQSAPLSILARMLGDVTPGSITIAVSLARISGKGLVGGETCASMHTGCSSAGFTRRSTAQGYARMEPTAPAKYVSLPTQLRSSVHFICQLDVWICGSLPQSILICCNGLHSYVTFCCFFCYVFLHTAHFCCSQWHWTLFSLASV